MTDRERVFQVVNDKCVAAAALVQTPIFRRDVTLHTDDKFVPYGAVTTLKITQVALLGDLKGAFSIDNICFS